MRATTPLVFCVGGNQTASTSKFQALNIRRLDWVEVVHKAKVGGSLN